jgi:hypothetical protein
VASKPLLTIFAIAPFGLPSRSDLNEIAQSKQKRLKFHNRKLQAFASIHSRYQSAIQNKKERTHLKNADEGSGQGAGRRKSGAYTQVCEHFEPIRNAALST